MVGSAKRTARGNGGTIMTARAILFDLRSVQPVSSYSFHGGRECCEAILEAVAHRLPANQMVAYYNPLAGIPERTRSLIECRQIELIPARTSAELARRLGDSSFGVHFRCVPPPNEPLHRHNANKTVCVAFGFRAIEMPVDCTERYYARSAARLGRFLLKNSFPGVYRRWRTAQWRRFLLQSTIDTLITISLHSKYSLLAFAGDVTAGDSVLSLYPPPPIVVQPDHVDFGALGTATRKYFLLVSANRWIKNVVRAVQALDSIYTMRPDLDLKTVVLGCPREASFVVPVRNPKQFIFRPYVPHGELQTLYANAFAFIYPTLNEGFGYPPMEAMQYGTPVLASAFSSTPEVCEGAAVYFNPYSVHEIAARILQLVLSPQQWTEYSERGRIRSARMRELQTRDRETLVNMLVAHSGSKDTA